MEHDDASPQQVLSNAHAPVKVCGYAPFGNIPEFYTTFGVKPGDTLHSDIAAAGGTTRCFRNQLSSGTNQPVPPTHATVLDQPPAPVRPTGALVDPVPPKPFGQPTMAKADYHVHAKGDLTLVDRAVGIFANEPIDIYVNPTYIPEQLAADYDRLWTPARMKKVVDGLAANGVAMEINNRRRIPSAAFIKLARQSGVKFACGTNNAGAADLGRNEYCEEMIRECGLRPENFWTPPANGAKAVQRRPLLR